MFARCLLVLLAAAELARYAESGSEHDFLSEKEMVLLLRGVDKSIREALVDDIDDLTLLAMVRKVRTLTGFQGAVQAHKDAKAIEPLFFDVRANLPRLCRTFNEWRNSSYVVLSDLAHHMLQNLGGECAHQQGRWSFLSAIAEFFGIDSINFMSTANKEIEV
eukprot:gb/GFBE01070241.1/.p1 GENE.gb/GFBE01070241.1/~~gb/GFBE01070241.1/.p1  ORF type:complete len:162 (+),score=26.38 gb/GFBE01070241.1/:1-486(+)